MRAAVTGVQRFAREITTRLGDLADVTLLAPRGVEPALRDVPVRKGRLRGHAWEQLELPRLARAAGCDVTLHLSGTAPFHGGPHVMVIHDVLPLTNPEWYSRRFARWYGAVLPRAAKRAAGIITVSEHSRYEIERILGVHRRLAVVTQGLWPFDQPSPAETVERIRRSLRLPDRFLLAVGHGDPRKNHGFLVDVLSELERRGEAQELVVVGAVPSRVHGRAPALDGPNVRQLDHVSDETLRALYTAASVLLFPTLAEGFGRPPLEVAACGTPALIADLPAVAEPARSAGWALPLVAGPWADAIIAMARDPVLRASVVARGRAAGRALSWDAAARQVLDICTATGAERPNRRPLHVTGA
jgi:glycosyltransferase involved in cell wall biosynthesis